ncbi:hypothetical protein D9619_000782 [Psilocybe cf. subviscida]|uniref:Uncharacterized protein n=1 Tax=Psilocybe cf. subviscida TaxID=2480587 RepID=A0A8H5BDE8_9AGAR|nr:hypothetical protein D9619_000782 [Psilocybe cf. subviscida]
MNHTTQIPWSEEMQHHLSVVNYACAAILLELAPRDELDVSDEMMQGIKAQQQQIIETLFQHTEHPFPGDLIEEYAGPLHERARSAIRWIIGIRSTLIKLAQENNSLRRRKQDPDMQIEAKKRIDCGREIRTALSNLKVSHRIYSNEIAALDEQINIVHERFNEHNIAQTHHIPIITALEDIIQPKVTQHYLKAVCDLDQELSKLFAESQERLCIMLQKIMT